LILPTKRINQERSLLFIGGEILTLLDEGKTISTIWNELKNKRELNKMKSPLKFDWFVLSLDLLFMMNIIKMDEGCYIKRNNS